MADRSLRIKLLADTSSYRSEMEKASKLGNNYYKSAQTGSQRLTAYLNQNTTSFAGLNKNIQLATTTMKSFVGVFAGGLAISGVADIADSYGQMAQRIRNTLKSIDGDFSNYETVQNRLVETSIRNAKELADSQELYIRSAESMKTLGYTTSQTLDFVESLSSAFTSNATSSDKVKSSIDAVNKSFVSGKVSAQQWQTLSAAMPNLAGQIATALGKERDEIVKLGNAGKLSITQLTNGTIKSKDAFNALADSMDNTIKDGFSQLSTAFQHWVGEANQTYKVTSTVTSGMTYLAKNFDLVVDSGAALIALALARYFGNLTTSIISSTAESAKNAIETRNIAIAQKEALTVKLANIQAEKQFLITTQASLAAQLRASKTEQDRLPIRQQMKANAAQIIALDKTETASKLSLATATKQASIASTALSKAQGLLKSGLNLLGGPMGAAMLAGGALFYFSQKSAEAKQQALELTNEVESLTEKLKGMSKVQKEAFAIDLKKKIMDQYDAVSKQESLIDSLRNKLDLTTSGRANYGNIADLRKRIDGAEKGLAVMNEGLNKSIDLYDELTVANHDAANSTDKLTESTKKLNDAGSGNLFDFDSSAYNDQKKRLEDLINNTKLLTEYDKIHYEIVNGGLKGIDPAQQKVLENLAKEIDLTKKREELKKSLDSLSSPMNKEEAQYTASNNLIRESLKLGLIDKKKANEKLESLELDHQLKMAQIKSSQEASEIDNAVALVDPVQALENENAKKLALIQEFENQKLLTEQQALALREAENYQYEQNRIAAQWEIWRNQSEANDFLASSLEGLASSATSTISGLMSGTMSATEAMQNFASVILNQAVGSLVQMGLQQVQNAITAKTASSTTTSAQLIEAGLLTKAYTSAAMQASIASYGAAAATGAAAYSTAIGTMKGVSLVGMAHDGIDNVPKEGTWLLQKGERVLSPSQNKDFSNLISGSNVSNSPQIIINNNAGAEVTATYDEKEEIIKIAVNKAKAEVASSVRQKQGDIWNAFSSTTNVTSKLR